MATHRCLSRCTNHSLPWTFASKGITTGGFLLDPANPGKPSIQQPHSRPRGKEERDLCTPRESRIRSPLSWGCQAGLKPDTWSHWHVSESHLADTCMPSLSLFCLSLCALRSPSKEGLFLCFPTFYIEKKIKIFSKVERMLY